MSQMSERLLAQRLRITDELGTGGSVECERWEVADALAAWYITGGDDMCDAHADAYYAPLLRNLQTAILGAYGEWERGIAELLGVSIVRL